MNISSMATATVFILAISGNPSSTPTIRVRGIIYGWDFKWGTTGLCPLGGGYFYISQNARSKETKQQSSTVRLYRWTGDADAPFRPVE